jgi:hypothetical protein
MDCDRSIVPVRTGKYNGPGGANLIVKTVHGETQIGMQIDNRTVAWAFDSSGKFQGLRAEATSRGPDRENERQKDGQTKEDRAKA